MSITTINSFVIGHEIGLAIKAIFVYIYIYSNLKLITAHSSLLFFSRAASSATVCVRAAKGEL